MWKSRVSEHRSLSYTVGRRAIQTKGKPKFRIPARGQEASTQHGPSIHTAASQSRPSSRESFPGDLIVNTVPLGKVWGAVFWGYYLPLLRVAGDYAGGCPIVWHYLWRESEYVKLWLIGGCLRMSDSPGSFSLGCVFLVEWGEFFLMWREHL